MWISEESSLPIALKTIRDMTTAMLVAAEHQRWTEVWRIDAARLKLLRTIPSELFRTDDDAMRRLLREALSATREIEEKALAERDSCQVELRHLNQRQHAAKAYDSYASASS